MPISDKLSQKITREAKAKGIGPLVSDLSEEQREYFYAILCNDEAASDEELINLFEEELPAVDPEVIKFFISRRRQFLIDFPLNYDL